MLLSWGFHCGPTDLFSLLMCSYSRELRGLFSANQNLCTPLEIGRTPGTSPLSNSGFHKKDIAGDFFLCQCNLKSPTPLFSKFGLNRLKAGLSRDLGRALHHCEKDSVSRIQAICYPHNKLHALQIIFRVNSSFYCLSFISDIANSQKQK